MAVVKELIRTEKMVPSALEIMRENQKSKVSDYPHQEICIVKTFKEITKLERNGMFVYESMPGTAVFNLLHRWKSDEFS